MFWSSGCARHSIPMQRSFESIPIDFYDWILGNWITIIHERDNSKGELNERTSSEYYTSNQVWQDFNHTKYALFPVLNEIASSIQNRHLCHFTSLSLMSMKTANFAKIIPESKDLKLSINIVETNVTIDVGVILPLFKPRNILT